MQAAPIDNVTRTLADTYGQFAIPFETAICRAMSLMATEYRGGSWSGWQLEDGALFVSPATDPMRLVSPVNNYRGVMTAEAAGLVASVQALHHLRDMTAQPIFTRHLRQLTVYIEGHPERQAIRQALA